MRNSFTIPNDTRDIPQFRKVNVKRFDRWRGYDYGSFLQTNWLFFFKWSNLYETFKFRVSGRHTWISW